MAKQKTWIAIVVAVLAIGGLAIIVLVGGSVYWITRHVDTVSASIADAEDEFARERARFASVTPLLEFSGGDAPTVRKAPGTRSRATGPMQTLHARFYDPEDGKLVRADVPYWLIRAATSLTVLPSVGSSLTVEEIENHGPGLLANGTGGTGEQILIWID